MSSRICVKSLPKHVTDDRLREHFSEKGEVTDAKVIRAKDGKSRQFGFVGYRTAQEADAAIKYFNRTFMDTSRISVEAAEKLGSASLTRPWSKYTKGSSAHRKLVEASKPQGPATVKAVQGAKKKTIEETSPEDGNPKLAEFLQLMQPRRKGAIWSNEDISLAPARPTHVAAKPASERRDALRPAQPAEEGEEESTSGAGSPGGSEDSDAPGAAMRDALVMDPSVSDMDYLRARVRKGLSSNVGGAAGPTGGDGDEDTSSSHSSMDRMQRGGECEEGRNVAGDEEGPNEGDEQGDEAGDGLDSARRRSNGEAGSRGAETEADMEVLTTARIEDTGRLFVRNLPFGTTDADLTEAFGKYGELTDVHVVVDKLTRKSRGIALVQFATTTDALAAHAALDGSIFQGRLLHVLPARRPPTQPPAAAAAAAKTAMGEAGFQAGRMAARRAGAGSAGDRAAWSALFMRPDTVAAAVAAHYGVSRAELLDREASDLPLRMALGETHVIALTKKALSDTGISVAALEAAAAASGHASAAAQLPRSKTALLVKNLPYAATEAELQELFARYGALARVVLPPTRALGVVEFLEPRDAGAAFRGLAYRRFHHVPLYLEWAPAAIFNTPQPPQGWAADRPSAPSGPCDALAGNPAAIAGDRAALAAGLLAEEEAGNESATLYVKNLAFLTTDDALRKHFTRAAMAAGGALRAARVARKSGPDGKPQSAGYGFVECSSEAVAKAVLQDLQGSMLGGHKLVLQLSTHKSRGAGLVAPAKDKEGATSAKLVVRNVAFEATRKDIAGLFGPFGQVKSCRLPKKFDGSHRGFAFIEFLTKGEARAAAAAVAGTHLYGRRLVVESAAADTGLDELRAKTAAHFRDDEDGGSAPPPNKRRKG